jgi:hypothetical protein
MKAIVLLVVCCVAFGCATKRNYELNEALVIKFSAYGGSPEEVTIPAGSIASITTHDGEVTSIDIRR